MRHWIVPYNIKNYQLDELFKQHDIIVWREGCTFADVGDIVYMYCFSPIKRLTYVMKVIAVGKDVTDFNDGTQYQIDKYHDPPILLKMEKRLPEDLRLSLYDLKKYGLDGYMREAWWICIAGDILSQIQNEVKRKSTLNINTNSALLLEGNVMQLTTNKYERDSIARERCIATRGCRCTVCGFDFEKAYGEVGKGFIHIHHIVPLAKIGKNYQLNPEKDLIPVCPNCHAMLHRPINGKLLSVQQLRDKLLKN